MRYLLDANVLIDAERDYQPLDRVPEFWEWLLHLAEQGRIKVPREVYDEVAQGKDDALAKWIKANRALLLETSEPDVEAVRHVTTNGYAPDLTEDELETLRADPLLVAYAFVAPRLIAVVTMERSKPRRERANRHLPDVCGDLGVTCIDTFELLRRLDFRTGWRQVRG